MLLLRLVLIIAAVPSYLVQYISYNPLPYANLPKLKLKMYLLALKCPKCHDNIHKI